ncbi:MAG TPA: GGDEF domain-containing protein [Acidobacteriaceae bacterium]
MPPLSTAVLYNQNVQLVCFGVILVLMARQDRRNRSLRWLAAMYICAMIGAIFDLGDRFFPHWLGWTIANLAAVTGYGCLQAGIVEFLRRGPRSRWLPILTNAVCLVLFPVWSMQPDGLNRIFSFQDFCLSLQSAACVWLLIWAKEKETLLPRQVLGCFLAIYSVVELARAAVYAVTGKTPEIAAPPIEVASAVVYIVACSMLPMAFLWMMNSRLHAHMARQMTTDPLTEVLNRRGLETEGEIHLARYNRTRRQFALVLADIDHFKRLNDAYGHAAGDMVLRELAGALAREIREADVIGRLGGEEFVLLFPDIEVAGAARLVERLREAMARKRFALGGESVAVTVSYGMTITAGRQSLSWAGLLNEADVALYEAKGAGRDRCVLYDGVTRLETETFEELLGTA